MSDQPFQACPRNRSRSSARCKSCTPDCPLYQSTEMKEVILGVDLEKLVDELELQEKLKKFIMFMR